MKAKAESVADVEKQVAGFIAKFDPEMAKLIREIRAALRKRFPTAVELVYDNYNFFVIGYGPSERPSEYLVSLAANSKGVALSFNHGSKLKDPHKILQGSGSVNRFLRLPGAAELKRAEVEELLQAAVAQLAVPLPEKGRGHTVIRSVAEKQRPRQG